MDLTYTGSAAKKIIARVLPYSCKPVTNSEEISYVAMKFISHRDTILSNLNITNLCPASL